MATPAESPDDAIAMLKLGTMAHRDSHGRLSLYDPLANARTTLAGETAGAADGAAVSADLAGDVGRETTATAAGDTVFAADVPPSFDDPRRRTPAWNIELTDSCTLSCRHCYQRPVKREAWQSAPAAGTAAWRPVVDGVLAAEPSEISLTGGEVMLFPELAEVLARIRAARPAMPIRLLLSGMSLWRRRGFRELLPSLAYNRVLVKLPIYSGRPAEHDWVTRSPGSLADVLRLIEELRQAGVAVLVSYLMLQRTCGQIAATCDFLEKLVGRDFVISTVVYPRRRPDRGGRAASLLPDVAVVRSLLQTTRFAAIASDYLSFQPQCRSGCRFPAVAMAGQAYGCTVCGASDCGNVRDDRAALGRAAAWLPPSTAVDASLPCGGCSARAVCKRCLCFFGPELPDAAYCQLVRACAEVVARRIGAAMAEGMRFVHEDAQRRWLSWREFAATGQAAAT
jgi:MoaA/NifB/PqqE/SkfB family radical SAM enzyme